VYGCLQVAFQGPRPQWYPSGRNWPV